MPKAEISILYVSFLTDEYGPAKKYRESTRAIVADALELVKKKKAEGWTRGDFVAALDKFDKDDAPC